MIIVRIWVLKCMTPCTTAPSTVCKCKVMSFLIYFDALVKSLDRTERLQGVCCSTFVPSLIDTTSSFLIRVTVCLNCFDPVMYLCSHTFHHGVRGVREHEEIKDMEITRCESVCLWDSPVNSAIIQKPLNSDWSEAVDEFSLTVVYNKALNQSYIIVSIAADHPQCCVWQLTCV